MVDGEDKDKAIQELPIMFYALVGLRTSGRVNTEHNKNVAKKILEVRPYL